MESSRWFRLSPLAREPDRGFPTAAQEGPPSAGEFSQRCAYTQTQLMRSPINAGGSDRPINSGFERGIPLMQSREPADAQQIVTGQSVDARNKRGPDDLCGDHSDHPQRRMTVGDEIERSQFHGDKQQSRRAEHRERGVRRSEE